MPSRFVPVVVGAAAAVLLLAMVPAQAGLRPADAPDRPGPPAAGAPLSARGVIVKATTASKARQRSLALAADRALPASIDVAGTTAGLDGISLVRFDETVNAARAASVADVLAQRPDVSWAIPNYVVRAQAAPPVTVNDPYFSAQRNLWDSTHPRPGGYSVKAPALWQATRGSSSVVVAVLDTGIRAGHPDLAGQLVAGYDFVDDECTDVGDYCENDGTYINAGDGNGIDGDPSDPGDWLDEQKMLECGLIDPVEADEYEFEDIPSSWHGTHVAGIIAAKANNGVGIAGVAPGVKVQPVRVLGHCGGTAWDIAMGILWAGGADLATLDSYYARVPTNRTPARIANLSLGIDVPPQEHAEVCEFFGDVAAEARSNGMAIVAAAGNSSGPQLANANLAAPASCRGFLSVAASSTTGHRAWYSNGGTSVDVAAPGGDTLVEGDSDVIWSTVISALKAPNSDYDTGGMEGTSMAAPTVAGGMALLASVGITNPDALDRAVRAAVSPFPPATAAYANTTITRGDMSFRAANLNCTTSVCGRGLFDLSTVTVLRGGPKVTRGTTSVKAVSAGLIGPPASSTITWWRGSRKVSNGPTYRLTGADLQAELVARHTITSGPSTGLTTATRLTVPRAHTRTTFSMPTRVTKSKRVKITVRVSATVGDALGNVRVYDGRKRIAIKRINPKDRGRITITLPRLKKGKHRIGVSFSGSPRFHASSSKRKVVRSR